MPRLVSHRCARFVVLAWALLWTGCVAPTEPTVQGAAAPAIACPPALVVSSSNGGAVDVVYAKPRVTGGTQPISTSCAPTIGATFPIGTTHVACSTTDGEQRTASCGFDVTVAVPTLAVETFVAFGDSITWGSSGTELPARCLTGSFDEPFSWLFEDLQSLLARAVPPSQAYPGVLESLLASRYVTQHFLVANEGLPGEGVTSAGTTNRLRTALDLHRPDVLLLKEGVNDLNGQKSIASIAGALRSLVRVAKERGIPVLLGTLPPEIPGSCRGKNGADRIVPMNAEIRQVAAAEGAMLVDLYQAFVGQEAAFIDNDGLHPTAAGYAAIGTAFFETIQQHFEAQGSAE